jgi:hypothetical protein
MGLSIGALTFSERKYPEWRVCVDGKQRLLTIRHFLIDAVPVPAEWFPPEHIASQALEGMVVYSGLTVVGQRVFDRQALATTNTAQGLTLADEELLFELINYGGVPQGEKDS